MMFDSIINSNYGRYNNSKNYYTPPSNFGGSSRAMEAAQLQLKAYDNIGSLGSPFGMDSVTLGDSQMDSAVENLRAMRRAKQMSQKLDVVKNMGSEGLPSDWENMPLDQFLAQAASIRSSLGPSKPAKEEGADKESGSGLDVKTHDYYNSAGDKVTVTKVTTSEAGNYRNRSNAYNSAGFDGFEATKDDITEGEYATVYVSYSDGVTIQRQVQNKGYAVDIYR